MLVESLRVSVPGALAESTMPRELDACHWENQKASVRASPRLRHACVAGNLVAPATYMPPPCELGFTRIYLHNVARAHQERFIEACAERVHPFFKPAVLEEPVR